MSLQDEVSPSIKPGDDFYGYVNQKWIDAHPIPDDKARLAVFNILSDENIDGLKNLLETRPKSSTRNNNLLRLYEFYHSSMNESQISKVGIQPLKSTFQTVRNIKSSSRLIQFISAQHSRGMSMVWGCGIEPDDKNSKRYILRLKQSGLGLPDRDYYFEKSKKYVAIRREYKNFLIKLFTLLGSNQPKKEAGNVYRLETKLASVSATAIEKRDVDAMYNLFTMGKLTSGFPDLDWKSYLSTLGLSSTKKLVISQPAFIRKALELMQSESFGVWQSYCQAHFVLPLMGKLPREFEDLRFDFYGKVLQGSKELEPRYRRMVQLCMQVLPDPVGQLFTEKYFPPKAKKEIYDLVGHIQAAFRERIQALLWMTGPTKKKALEKLDAFVPMLGYPDKWVDYGSLDTSKSFVENYMAVTDFEWQRWVSRISKPVDRKEWLMSPAMVNAYYWSNTNVIVFPAGILQPPFFDAQGDFAANYGAIGAIIGHEITHGFDDKGSKFDKDGNLKSWWTKNDCKDFERRARVLERQFNLYKIEGHQVKGKLTLGENIADLGGMLVAYDALQKKLSETGGSELVDGFTPEQRFFMAWARGWRSNTRPELALHLLIVDPHSPNELRTNGVVTNCDVFYEVFDVKPGDKLYKPPSKRVRIW